MNVVVIGSLSKSEKMEEVKKFFEDLGNAVSIPSEMQDLPLITIQEEWIQKIKNADLIVAIPKVSHLCFKDEPSTNLMYSFGESTSYEMAIANEFEKRIMIWTD